MTTEITIHHCTLRLIRRGGWGWGTDPKGLLANAMRVLPGVIAAKLSELWPGHTDREIAAPLSIRMPVRLEELGGQGHLGGDAWTVVVANPILEQRIDCAVRVLIEEICGRPSALAEPRENVILIEPENAGAELFPEALWRGTVLRVLRSWQRQGVLLARLTAFSQEALEAWHASLTNTPKTVFEAARPAAHAALLALANEVAATAIPLPLGRPKALIQRLLIIVEASVRLAMTPDDVALNAVLNAVVPFSPNRLSDAPNGLAKSPILVRVAAQEKGHGRRGVRADLPAPRRSAAPPRSRALSERHVPSALPFLLLGPLARVGYLDTLAAVLSAGGLLDDLSTFATALARKVLDPPERGWYRHPEAVANAAVLAAMADPVPDPEISDFARKVAPHLSPLDAVLGGALVDGHRKDQPLLIRRTQGAEGNGFLLLDSDGIFPIAWVEHLPRLFPQLANLSGTPVLVPQESAAGDVLGQLDEAGFTFVTDAPPGRGEPWRRVTSPLGVRWWTNRQKEPAALYSAADKLAFADEKSAALSRAMGLRPACPVGSASALEISLTLAASFALGTIAWILWRDREWVHPLLALERFRDLDARVRFDLRAVTVRLALGRRSRDLYEHGLIADIHKVPWFCGRTLRFSGG